MSCLSMNKTLVLASLTNSINNNPKLKTKKNPNVHLHQESKKPHKPSISQIERAIGAGPLYRDNDPKDLDKITNVVNGLVMNSTADEFELEIQKKLRETGESFVNVTEKGFRSSGKTILLFVFQWILPIWILSLLVASGVIKLPFSTPFLDDLIL